MTASSDRALDGLRVISLGNFVAGNSFAMTLAELGADVVKVESRTRTDPVRMRFTADHPQVLEPSGTETTALFGGLSRSVRDLALDMKAPGAAALLLRLARAADVLFENFGAGVLEHWGVPWSELSRANPGLVMISVSGYGRTGPMARYLAYGGNVSAFVGLTHLWQDSHGSIYDYIAGSHAAAAVLAALRVRDRTGQGSYIDLAQIEAAAALLAPALLDGLNGGEDPPPPGNKVPGAWLSGVYRCLGADRWLAVEVGDQPGWESLRQVLGLPAQPAVGRSVAGPPVAGPPVAGQSAAGPLPTAERAEVDACLRDWAAARGHWAAAWTLQRAGVAAAPVQDSEDVWRDPQLRARGAITEVVHPDLGRYEYPAPIHRMTGTPAAVRGPAPRLGQDTRYVLTEWLGLGTAEVADLISAGLVATDDPEQT